LADLATIRYFFGRPVGERIWGEILISTSAATAAAA